MGTDIDVSLQIKKDGQWVFNENPIFGYEPSPSPFDYRDKNMYQFFLGLFNEGVECILKEPNGVPEGYEQIESDYDYWHCHIYLKDLLEFDYEKITTDYYDKKKVTVRDCLGDYFFKQVELMKSLGNSEDIRIVFWFS